MRSIILAVIGIVAVAPAAAPQEAPAALKGLDPVELCGGKEMPGEEDLIVERGGFRYRFASPESRMAFENEPERYEIKWGGACGRMGPLSGRGNPNRFLVHDGHIYLFASDQCRRGFAKDPARCLEPDDSVPDSDADSRAKGRALLERALAAHGGAAVIDAVKSFAARRAWKEESGGKTYDRFAVMLVRFPEDFRDDDHWGDEYRYATVTTAADAFLLSNGKATTLNPAGVREFRRRFHRNPLLILRSRSRSGFQAIALGRKSTGAGEVDQLAVAFDHMTTTLGIDPATGHIVTAAFRGRGPTGGFGDRIETYSEFHEKAGILVPFTTSLIFEGQPVPEGGFTWDDVGFDGAVDPAIFTRPTG